MSEPVKFMFDRAFDGGARNRFDEELVKLRQSADEASKQALQKGLTDGRTQALESLEAQTLEIVKIIEQKLEALFEQHDALEHRLRQDMIRLAHMIATRFAPRLMARFPLDEMAHLVETCLVDAREEAQIIIHLPSDFITPMEKISKQLQESRRFKGEVLLIPAPNLHGTDMHIEWSNGGAERLEAHILSKIDQIIETYLDANHTLKATSQSFDDPSTEN